MSQSLEVSATGRSHVQRGRTDCSCVCQCSWSGAAIIPCTYGQYVGQVKLRK